jgi:hypothetical protein
MYNVSMETSNEQHSRSFFRRHAVDLVAVLALGAGVVGIEQAAEYVADRVSHMQLDIGDSIIEHPMAG